MIHHVVPENVKFGFVTFLKNYVLGGRSGPFGCQSAGTLRTYHDSFIIQRNERELAKLVVAKVGPDGNAVLPPAA